MTMAITETFQEFVGNFGSYSWVVLFVNAPIDTVSKVYSEAIQREIVQNFPISVAPSDQYDPTGAVVQVTDRDWIIIFHHVGRYCPLESVSDFVQQLNAKVLVFSGEDTSGAVDCVLYSPGNVVTRYQTAEDFEYEAEIYEEMGQPSPPHPSTVIESYDGLFQSLGIRTVELTLNEARTAASADEAYVHQIQRLDLVTQPL